MGCFAWHYTKQGSRCLHYSDVIMGPVASQITSLTTILSTVYSDRRRSKKTSTFRVSAFVRWILPGTIEFPAQLASNAEKLSIWWRHHVPPDFFVNLYISPLHWKCQYLHYDINILYVVIYLILDPLKTFAHSPSTKFELHVEIC